MIDITLAYTEGGTEYTHDFELLSLKGYDDIDQVEIVGVQHRHLDGSISEQIRGYRRILSLDFGVLQDFEGRLFLVNFIRNSDREVRKASSGFVNAVLIDWERFVNEWKDNLAIGRRFYLELVQSEIQQTFRLGYGKRYGKTYGTHL